MIDYPMSNTKAHSQPSAAEEPQHTWVPTSVPFVDVLQQYLARSKENGRAIERSEFRQYLVEVKQLAKSTASAYSSPIKKTELNLPERSLEALELIAKGGASGLKALGSPFIAREGRTQVYLVDAFLAGICPQIASKHGLKAQDLLVHAGFAGKNTSADILLQVGNQVGQHFGLLENGQPTKEFHTYFDTALDHLKDQLEEAADDADTEK